MTSGPAQPEAPRAAAAGPAEPQAARRATASPAGAPVAGGEGAAGDGFRAASDTVPPIPRTAPRFADPRAQHTDAMTQPPPPASARFPDTPPQPARPASPPRGGDTGTPARAESRPSAQPNVPRSAPPRDFRRAPRVTRPAPRPADPPASSAGPQAPAATTDSGFFGAPPSRAAAPDASGPAASAASRPLGAPPSRAAAPDVSGSDIPRPAASDDVRSGGAAAAPSRPLGSDGGSASVADSGWSPLPRSWVPAPGPQRQEAEAGSAGSGERQSAPEADGWAAWSPGAAVRQPDFVGPAEPTAPETPRRPDVAPDVPSGPDPALSWSAPVAPGGTRATPGAMRPVVTFARPEGYRGRFGRRGRTAAAAACVVLGLGLIGGAVTGSWLVGDSEDTGERSTYVTAGGLWHNVPVDQLFPPTVDGQGAGPGGADRTWTRIAVAPDSGCADAFDPLLEQVLAPVGCTRLLRATYTDATQSYVTTVGLLFTKADATAMRSLDSRFAKEGLAQRADLMPRPYAAKDTVAAAFGDKQRAAWTVSVLTDAPVVVYAVSGWADGRDVDTPQPAPAATATGATTAPAQAGLGNEAQGLADRVERGLRKTVVTPSEHPS
ncbi:hypothetical protein OG352_08290 [Streptomyces sp. NBC_01485]|uniref:hypothetical protein n=1 Tax=Streptomyces sp. NBC_01485 TaxID=2903884 RepID=UPI002E380456|nr:hypothetical protein [Streptomyces sp. NBC_01485]